MVKNAKIEKIHNETFLVIFKQCEWEENYYLATVKIEFFIFSFSPREKHDFLRLNESNHSSLNFDHNNFLRGLIFSLSQTESRLLSLSFLKYLDSKGDVNSSFLPSSKKFSSPAWFTYLRSTQIFFFSNPSISQF